MVIYIYQAAPTRRFYSIFHRSDLIESETRESFSPLRRYELGRTLTHRWPWYRRALNFTEVITRFIEAWPGSIQVVSGGTSISPLISAFISINSHNQNSLWGFEVDETAELARGKLLNQKPAAVWNIHIECSRHSTVLDKFSFEHASMNLHDHDHWHRWGRGRGPRIRNNAKIEGKREKKK